MPDWLEVVEAFTCDRRVDGRDHNALDGLPFYAEKVSPPPAAEPSATAVPGK